MKLNQVNQTEKTISTAEFKSFEKIFSIVREELLCRRIRNKPRLENCTELTVVFLSRREMKKINLKFRKKNKATDVLSFSAIEESSLGELLFCEDVLKEQAKNQGHSLLIEKTYMLIHGILHLLGYDHELSKKEHRLMFALQEACFLRVKQRAAKYFH